MLRALLPLLFLLVLPSGGLCACSMSHVPSGCGPVDVTLTGGVSRFDGGGDASAAEAACERFCANQMCEVVSETQLRCQPSCL